VNGYYWNDHQYNQLIKCVGGSCSEFSTPNMITDITDNSDLIVDTCYNLILNGESLSSIRYKQLDDNYQYKIFGHPDNAFNDPKKIYYIKVDKNSIITDGSGKSLLIFLLIYIYYINLLIYIYFFFYLNGLFTINTENVKPGYYKIAGSNNYYQCDNTDCSKVTLESECNATNVGKLFENNGQAALCLNFFDNQPIWTNAATSGKYFVKYNANNIFGLSDNQYGLIRVTQNSITLSEETKGNLCIHILI